MITTRTHKRSRKATWKKIKRITHNTILIIITIIAVFSLLIAFGCADTIPSHKPFIVACISLVWLALFLYANKYHGK